MDININTSQEKRKKKLQLCFFQIRKGLTKTKVIVQKSQQKKKIGIIIVIENMDFMNLYQFVRYYSVTSLCLDCNIVLWTFSAPGVAPLVQTVGPQTILSLSYLRDFFFFFFFTKFLLLSFHRQGEEGRRWGVG